MTTLKCKTLALIIILQLSTDSLCSMHQTLKRLSAVMNEQSFKEVAKYSHNFLLSNINKLLVK